MDHTPAHPGAAPAPLSNPHLVRMIAERAQTLFERFGIKRTRLDCMMDIENAHDAVGLDLLRLLTAPDGDFAHDIGGIARHLNRHTGELTDGFMPRLTAPKNSGLDKFDRLATLGSFAIRTLESDAEWGAGTIDKIAAEAHRLQLAESDDDCRFRRKV